MNLDENSLLVWSYNALAGCLAWIATYTEINVEPATILAILMAIDFFAGTQAAYKRGEDISSYKMKIGIIGKLLILMIPLTIQLMSKGTGIDLGLFLVWCIYILILSEGYSVISNIVCFHSGKNLPELDAVALIGHKLKVIIKEIIK